MATKTITIMEDAYEMLLRLKKGNESFSDLIRDLAKNRRGSVEAVLGCAGLWENLLTDEEAEEMKREIIKERKSSTKKLLERVKNL